jgi:uncharacterized protein (DUF433 family)
MGEIVKLSLVRHMLPGWLALTRRRQRVATGTARDLGLGDGIYTVPDAARILRQFGKTNETPRRLRAWSRRSATFGEHDSPSGVRVLSFLDLVSLEVVGRLTQAGVRFARIKQVERSLRSLDPGLKHPFASRIFFTDGSKVWVDHVGERIEVAGYPMQYVHAAAIQPFVTEIAFDEGSKLATRWEVNEWVEIDPRIQFGQPVIRGTRVPVRTVLANLKAGSPAEVADWYDLDVDQVEGVRTLSAAS